MQAAKFLHMLHIYRIFDLPYQSQIVPLAAILADIGDAWEHEANRAKLIRWYWNGVFGELYGSAIETPGRTRLHGGSGVARWRPGALHGFRDAVQVGPPQDDENAIVGGLQGSERFVDEGRRAGFPVGPAVRSHGVLRRKRRHPSHLSAGLVQRPGNQASTSTTPSSTRRRCRIAPTG